MTEEMPEKYNKAVNGDIKGDAIATCPSMNSLDEQLVAEESLESSNTLKKQIGFFQGFTLMIGNFLVIVCSLSTVEPTAKHLLTWYHTIINQHEFYRFPTHFGYLYTSMTI